jgi:hypothetical protein
LRNLKKTKTLELVMDKKSTRSVKGPRADKEKKQKDDTVPFVLPAIKICSGFNVFRLDIYPTMR